MDHNVSAAVEREVRELEYRMIHVLLLSPEAA